MPAFMLTDIVDRADMRMIEWVLVQTLTCGHGWHNE
jgi:hypothetical protein